MEKQGIVYEKIHIDGINDYWVVKSCKGWKKNITLEHKIKEVPVRGIMPYAFINKYALESIVIPDSYEYIGEYAFLGCDNLKNVYISVSDVPNVKNELTLHEGCFQNCYHLENIIGNKVLNIVETKVFMNCCNLKIFGYCNQITGNIPASSFRGCRSLEFVHNIGEKCRIYSDSFLGCSNLSKIRFDCSKVILPKSVINTFISKKIICPAKSNLVNLAYEGVHIEIC